MQIKLRSVAWSRARLSWGAGLAPLRERALRSLVVEAGAADVGDGDTKSGLQIQIVVDWCLEMVMSVTVTLSLVWIYSGYWC